MKISNLYFLNFFIAFVLFSAPVISSLYNFSPGQNWYLIKDLAVVVMLLFALSISTQALNANILYLLIPVLIVSAYGVLFSDSNLFLQVASLRQFLVPFEFVLIGYLVVRSQCDYLRLSYATLLVVFVILIFGFFERFTYFWQLVPVEAFFTAKNIPVFVTGYPVFWIEPISLLGFRPFDAGVPRMVSTVFDPINLGAIFVFAYTLLLFEGKAFFSSFFRKIYLVGLLVGIFLTFSKGAWLQLILTVFIFNTRVPLPWKIFVVLACSPFVYAFVLYHAGFEAHLIGFVEIFHHLTILGGGLGSFGNYTAMFSNSTVTGVGDSYWAAVMGQFGFLGFIIWFLTFLWIIARLGLTHYLSWLLMSQLLVSALSENAFNFMSVFLLMIFVGGFLRLKDKKAV
ncbi:hypothetical protein [Hydrogenovibrio thermophilus]|uniref:O-antigen ligase domain-containing protein n=1 Tax=Hydrogenovibrio thermophilus TaxID=265883 RepID=A0A410H4C4_9GAMM|nr:hypothetical protein [Hydrogenovibrio thermophilus]QAB15785.1 hypothetical protein EPV75_08935 [Hydrogenovibrio thermophilus]